MDIYQHIIEHYGHFKSVDRIILVWNNLNLTQFPLPSASQFNVLCDIVILPQEVNEIQNRYATHPYIRTDAVLNLDDDITLNLEDVELGWQTWQHYPDQLIGYKARSHTKKKDGTFKYSFNTREYYSIVIGAAFWAHKKYYELYTSDHPLFKQMKAYVSEDRACDDIAMNCLVSYVTSKPPVWVRAEIIKYDSAGHKGLSLAYKWTETRGNCIAQMERILGKDPLRRNQMIIERRQYNAQLHVLQWLRDTPLVIWALETLGFA